MGKDMSIAECPTCYFLDERIREWQAKGNNKEASEMGVLLREHQTRYHNSSANEVSALLPLDPI